MKNPIRKFYEFITEKYKIFTYRVWDNKYELWDIRLAKYAGIVIWGFASIFYIIIFIPLWFLNLFISGEED